MKLDTIASIIFAKHHIPKRVFTITDGGIIDLNEPLGNGDYINYSMIFDYWARQADISLDVMLRIRNFVIEDSI